MHTAKCLFAECQKKALGKDAFCRVPKNGTRQNTSLPSAEKKHSAKSSLPSAEKNTRQSRLCRVPDKIHSAKLPALGKVPVSSSGECLLDSSLLFEVMVVLCPDQWRCLGVSYSLVSCKLCTVNFN